MDTRGRKSKKPISNKTSDAKSCTSAVTSCKRSDIQSPQQSKAVSPTALHDLQVAKTLLEAEKEKVKSLQETIKHLQADKEFLKDQLSRMTASSSSHSRSSSISAFQIIYRCSKRKRKKSCVCSAVSIYNMMACNSTPNCSPSDVVNGSGTTGKKAVETEEEESRDEIAVLSTESTTIDDSDDEEMKPPSKGKKARSTKQYDLGRTRVIMRYKRALHAFNQGGSMKKAFQKVGVDRNTISRTSPIPELAIAAPGVFQALPPWNAQVEKLSTFVDRCREATTDKIKEKIIQMKACGELLPVTH